MKIRPLAALLALAGMLFALLMPASTATAADPVIPQLTGVRAAASPTYDRVVFSFDGPLPQTRLVQKVDQLYYDGTGFPVGISGAKFLELTMYNARAHNYDTGAASAPTRVVPGLPNVAEIRQTGDFESAVTYGIALVKDMPYKMFTLSNPSRVVLDISSDFPKVTRKVYFQNASNYAKGISPYTESRSRIVPASSPASAVLHHFFAGPTAAERAYGLKAVKSGAYGFTKLSVTESVARVQLRGGCSGTTTSGAAYTVANQIRPALKQFSNVSWVKIYDKTGATARPTGYSDSVPFCLEP